jgi:hypothetical protein
MPKKLATDDVAEKIYTGLMSREFEKWYVGEFEDHIGGDIGSKSKPQILEKIKKLFHLTD